jgi:hypothetical protein
VTDAPGLDELDRLSTEELRRRAFERAERRHDVGFFWDLLRHLRGSGELASEDASAGNITGGIAELVETVREFFGHGLDDQEDFVRARFIDYLRES